MSFMDGANEGDDEPAALDDTVLSLTRLSKNVTLEPGPKPSHQRLVFADPVAFR